MSIVQLFIQYATSIVAIVGLVLSLYQYFRSSRVQRRTQAELVSAWWVRIDKDSKLNLSLGNYANPISDAPQYYVGLLLQNSSTAPVYDLRIVAPGFVMIDGNRWEFTAEFHYKLDLLPPGEFVCFQITNQEDDKKKVKRKWAYPELVSSAPGKIRPICNNKEWIVSSIKFKDASGNSWERTKSNGLRQTRENQLFSCDRPAECECRVVTK